MDIQAVKPVSSVAVSPGKGSPVAPADSGKNLPPVPTGIDPVVVQDSREKHAALARQINSYLHSNSRQLEFRVDAESGDPVITVRDAEGNVVRRIPGEDALEMLRRLSVDPGTLVDSLV
jgi:flagellar protein FlaG